MTDEMTDDEMKQNPAPDPLQAFGAGIWLLDGDEVSMLGIPFRTRSTVIRLADGGLWLHSPVQPTPSRVAAVGALGDVRHLIAPCKTHHLFVEPWAEHFPGARKWGGPGVADRIDHVEWDGKLTGTPPPDWSDEIDQIIFRGSAVLDEAVFFHRRSKSLLITDIVQNHDPYKDGLFWQWVKDINGVLAPTGGTPKDWKATVTDLFAARVSRDAMFEWPFERVVLCHGEVITENARSHMERAFGWLDEI